MGKSQHREEASNVGYVSQAYSSCQSKFDCQSNGSCQSKDSCQSNSSCQSSRLLVLHLLLGSPVHDESPHPGSKVGTDRLPRQPGGQEERDMSWEEEERVGTGGMG